MKNRIRSEEKKGTDDIQHTIDSYWIWNILFKKNRGTIDLIIDQIVSFVQ